MTRRPPLFPRRDRDPFSLIAPRVHCDERLKQCVDRFDILTIHYRAVSRLQAHGFQGGHTAATVLDLLPVKR